MSVWNIAWRNLRSRPIQSWLTVTVVAIGLALGLSMFLISQGLREGLARVTQPYDLIIGAKGSPTQLVLSSLFLQDKPGHNLTFDFYASLLGDKRVAQAIPLAMGDSAAGYWVVGTNQEYFNLTARPGGPPVWRLAEGRFFERPFEAVLGAQVARKLGLKPGDRLPSSHGLVADLEEGKNQPNEEESGGQTGIDDHHRSFPYAVVGILQPTFGPGDQGIYVDRRSYWEIHAHDREVNDLPGLEGKEPGGITAVLVKPTSYTAAYQLYQEINAGPVAQVVFPAQVVTKLFDFLGQAETLLEGISLVVLFLATLSIIISLYSAALERRRDLAVLRALGASRATLMKIVLVEAALVASLGSLLGVALAHILAQILSWLIYDGSALHITTRFLPEELGVTLGIVVLGLVAGLLPAIRAYRSEVAKNLVL
ncbi:MAG: ABC transporter permease [Firmicutes bacterium]|nr:ABC transporter permease [Bacillota bacterium]MCL5040000.1 ABC transporter permease [Bacillota bacterium]